MRVSVDKTDHGYREDALWAKVLVQGNPRVFVFTADDSTGLLIRPKKDANGHSVFDAKGDLITERVYVFRNLLTIDISECPLDLVWYKNRWVLRKDAP